MCVPQFCNYPDPNDDGTEIKPVSGAWFDIASLTSAYLPDWSYIIPKSYLLLLACLCRCICYLTVLGFFHKVIDKIHFSPAHLILNLIVLLTIASNTRIGTSILSILLQIFAFNVVLVAVIIWLPYSTAVHVGKDLHHSSLYKMSLTKRRLYAFSCSVSILIGILPQLNQDLFSRTG